ncbi:MAG: polysulfide reductase NrfD [Anaerolineae bacterium]|nr:polysulfide reductase NrfD [Anaerolineae bacterium]
MSALVNRVTTFARRSPLYTAWVGLLAFAFLIGAGAIVYVLANGLQVTHLTNQLPWGLWITIDLSSIALGAGAFTLSAAVYIFRLHRYEAIARAAVFVGLLGYTSAMIALFIDIGRPDRFYHPVIFWNVHSVLWEITMCVIFYTSVLAMEVIPIVIESTPLNNNRFLHNLAHVLHRIMPVAALFGMGLSLLHQSSLGATYGVLTARPVWYSPSAPVLFILSAVSGGVGLVIAVTLVTGRVTRKRLVPPDVLNGVARFAGFVALAYLYLKIWSWAATNYYSHSPAIEHDLELLGEHTPYGFTFWWFEILLGSLVPAILFLWPRSRNNRYALMLAGILSVLGVVVFRWNMTLAGFVVPMDWSPGVADTFPVASYTPALVEWLVGMGIIAYSWLAWSLGARFLRLYPYAVSFDEIADGGNDVATDDSPAEPDAPEASPAAAR